jgi:intracellular septation protein
MSDDPTPGAPAEPKPAPRGKFLFDFGPLVVFFVGYKVGGVLVATAAFMVAMTIALVWTWIRDRRLPPMMIVTAVVVLVFGGLTVGLREPRFIYVKPTIDSALMGLALLGGMATGRPLLKPLLGSALALRDAGWRALSVRFGIFWLVLALLNELVWRSVTPERESLWVWFKFLGIPALTLAFLLTQAGLFRRHMIEPAPAPEAKP